MLCDIPSLNTQSCNRRPLCSTLTDSDLRICAALRKNPVLFQKKIQNILFFKFIMQLFSADASVFSDWGDIAERFKKYQICRRL